MDLPAIALIEPVLLGAILVAHYALLLGLSVYGAHRLYHLLVLRRRLGSRRSDAEPNDANFRPRVTVQLPIYNEKYVVERLLVQVARLQWPRDRLQIQLVDDSTDETTCLAQRKIADLRRKGLTIEHVRREDRSGYKAGGLDHAMASATGEFIAIFDADFMPRSDFLERTIPRFRNSEVGMVQTRWSYLNRERNWLTRIQALMLDAHFAVEQIIRSGTGAFFNFNGTGGVWRRSAIEGAGGWQADTLTEDMDLSYRAQLQGWTFLYLEDTDCPSELPTTMPAFKTQQHRWAKGAIEVMKKILPPLWRSDHSLHVKVEATFHLTGNLCYVFMLLDCVFFLVPSIFIREAQGFGHWLWLDIPIIVFTSLSHGFYYLYGQHRLGENLVKRFALMPLVFATSIGLCVNNTRAVLEALAGQVSGFVRTPKSGDRSGGNAVKALRTSTDYAALYARGADRIEVALAFVFIAFVASSALLGVWTGAVFLSPFAIGFAYIGGQSQIARLAQNRLERVSLASHPQDEPIR